jgi:hypothetical protein
MSSKENVQRLAKGKWVEEPKNILILLIFSMVFFLAQLFQRAIVQKITALPVKGLSKL